MKPIKTITRAEAIFSDDEKHRLYLKKVWNTKLPIATVITKFPRYEGQIKSDLTTQLIVNNLYDMGMGGFYLVNLFTNVELSNRMDEVEDILHEETDKYILEAVENSESIILAWGSTSSKIITNRIKEVETLLEPFEDKIQLLLNPTTKQISHPLNPKSRTFWMIEKRKNR